MCASIFFLDGEFAQAMIRCKTTEYWSVLKRFFWGENGVNRKYGVELFFNFLYNYGNDFIRGEALNVYFDDLQSLSTDIDEFIRSENKMKIFHVIGWVTFITIFLDDLKKMNYLREEAFKIYARSTSCCESVFNMNSFCDSSCFNIMLDIADYWNDLYTVIIEILELSFR